MEKKKSSEDGAHPPATRRQPTPGGPEVRRSPPSTPAARSCCHREGEDADAAEFDLGIDRVVAPQASRDSFLTPTAGLGLI